jgi:hypothetical protein
MRNRKVGQEVHVLFILVILCTTIFFCHSLIRLCVLALHPPDETPRIPSMTGPEGFRPVRPIPVTLARDEEMLLESEGKEIEGLKQPPPAYGLWRSSVRVDPNLLHWARADQVQAQGLGITPSHSRRSSTSPVSRRPSLNPLSNSRRPSDAVPSVSNSRRPSLNQLSSSRRPSASPDPSISGTSITTWPLGNNTNSDDAATHVHPPPTAGESEQGPRPPSYVSEDGVNYVVEAVPRSVAPSHAQVREIRITQTGDRRVPLFGEQTPSDGLPRQGARGGDVHPVWRS